jgi:hypothetical protein
MRQQAHTGKSIKIGGDVKLRQLSTFAAVLSHEQTGKLHSREAGSQFARQKPATTADVSNGAPQLLP